MYKCKTEDIDLCDSSHPLSPLWLKSSRITFVTQVIPYHLCGSSHPVSPLWLKSSRITFVTQVIPYHLCGSSHPVSPLSHYASVVIVAIK